MLAPTVRDALTTERTVDITTTGRRSGTPQRLEIWFHERDGRVYVTGLPGRRGWYANLLADPRMTFHLKGAVRADLPATARPVTDPQERRETFGWILAGLGREAQFDDWLARSPLVELDFDDA